MRAAFALRIFSGKIIYNFAILENLRIFQNCLFTGGVVKGNGWCSARFLRKQSRCGQRARPLSQILSALTALPKGEPLAVHANVTSLPRPLPLGEVASRSDDGEGEPVCGGDTFSLCHLPVSTNKAPPFGGAGERSEPERVRFALEPETFPPCQRLPPRGSWQNRQVLTEGVKASPWGSCRTK